MEQIQSLLSTFQQSYNWKQIDQAQQSKDWFRMRLGVLTASNASKIVAKVDSQTRATYMMELVAQVATGESKALNAYAVEWGKQMEGPARAAFEFLYGKPIAEVPFIFKDENFRCGASPDGLIFEDMVGVEIKCPIDSTNHVASLIEDKIRSEYKWQIQYQMWVTGANRWQFGSYDPRFMAKPLHLVDVERDPKKIATLEDAVPQFIHDLDLMLEKVGLTFGEQWKYETGA